MTKILILFLGLTMIAGANEFDRFFDEYYLPFNPSNATTSGFHQYDTKLEDYSRGAIEEATGLLHRLETYYAKFPPSADRDIVLGKIRADLLDMEQIRPWEKNPDIYSSGITNAVFVIISRSFAPPEQRLRSVIAREKQAPAVFAAARANLRNPPRIYTEIALEQLPGILSFFERDVPAAFRTVKDEKLLAEFQSTNRAVIGALRDYETFLKSDVLPRSHGDFRIGAENYRKKLLYEEMVDQPLDRLLEVGFRNLRENQRTFQEVAAKLDPNKTPAQVLEELDRDHPKPQDLLATFRNALGGLRDYIVKHNIVTIPSPAQPIVEETPPFLRALTFASMDTPGPYEKVATEAFFNVTLPERSWTREQIEQHMSGFNRGTVMSTAIHEVYPGHYVQFLWVQRAPDKVRKLLGAGSNAEGWAHYCEQMMLDEGYGNGDLWLRLGQVQDALLRNARYIVGIEMHTGKMTFDEGVSFFVKEGYQTRANALRETERGTSDPTYLVYTLGKLEILKLREDYREMRGSKFSLEEFHNRFLQQGYPPIKIVRRELMGRDGPML